MRMPKDIGNAAFPRLSLGRSCIFVEILKLSNSYISFRKLGHYFQVSAHKKNIA